MEIWKIKLKPEDLNTSSALRAGVGQRGLPFKDFLDEAVKICNTYPGNLDLILRVNIKNKNSFKITSLGPTATSLIKSFQRNDPEIAFSEDEAKQILNLNRIFWESRAMNPENAINVVKSTLKSFKESYVKKIN